MKTKKIKLNDLKVESFVTAMDKNKIHTVNGGFKLPPNEPTNHWACTNGAECDTNICHD